MKLQVLRGKMKKTPTDNQAGVIQKYIPLFLLFSWLNNGTVQLAHSHLLEVGAGCLL